MVSNLEVKLATCLRMRKGWRCALYIHWLLAAADTFRCEDMSRLPLDC